MQIADFLAVFADELARGAETFASEAATVARAPAGAPELAAAAAVYAGQLERTRETAEMLGLSGLVALADTLALNVAAVAELAPAAREAAMQHLAHWPARFVDYLGAPGDADAIGRLISFAADPLLPQPLLLEYAEPIIAALGAPPSLPDSVAADIAEAAPAGAAVDAAGPPPVMPAELVLALPHDLDAAVRDAFLAEAPEHAAALARATAAIVAGRAGEADRRAAHRHAHSLKGSASIVGARAIATLAHPLEDLLEAIEREPGAIDATLARVLTDGAAALGQMVDALGGEDDPPVDLGPMVGEARRLAWAVQRGRLDTVLPPLPRIGTSAAVVAQARPIAATKAQPAMAPIAAEQAAPSPSPPAAPAPAGDSALRVPVKTIDEFFRLLGESQTRGLRFQTELAQLQQDVRLLREHIEAVGVPADAASCRELERAAALGEATGTRLAFLAAELTLQQRVQRDLARIVLSTRMLPVANLVPRLARNVRQTCRQTGKEAELRVIGEDILVDGDMLEALADPLLHILRNAIDHGIEPLEQRRLAGKSDTGLVELVFERRGPVVTVSVRDDGKGLDYEAIRRKGIARGLMGPEQVLTRRELARLTLQAGFSTKEAVSEISGRGVGMDVVAERLARMKGSVDIESEPGAGCRITLRFQATLVSQHALLVGCGGHTFAIPSHMVEFALAAGSAGYVIDGGFPGLQHRGRVYRLHSLARLLGFPAERASADAMQVQPALVVRGDDGVVALLVDQLMDGREFVVKSAGRYLRRYPGLAGAVVLPSAAIAPVLDIAQLLRAAREPDERASPRPEDLVMP